MLEEALALDPFNPTLHYELGTALMQNERWDEARAALEKSLELEPAQPNAHTYLGSLSLREWRRCWHWPEQLPQRDCCGPEGSRTARACSPSSSTSLGSSKIADDVPGARLRPGSDQFEVAYRLDMLRAISVGDVEGSVAAARRDHRRRSRRTAAFAFGGAVQHLLRTVRTGRSHRGRTGLDQRAGSPGILDVDAARVPQRYRNVQGVAFDAWIQTLTDRRSSETARCSARLCRIDMGFDPTDNPDAHVSILCDARTNERGDRGRPRGSIFTESVAMHLDWRADWIAQPQFADIIAKTRACRTLCSRNGKKKKEALRGSVQSWFCRHARRDLVAGRGYLLHRILPTHRPLGCRL